jgi:RimJ/RimL family protein N-acetyltransferase
MLVAFGGLWYYRGPPELELVYGIAETHWGRGLATELARALVDCAFGELGLAEVRASTDTANSSSVRVLEKLGFSLVGRAVVDNLDTVFYRRTRSAGVAVPSTATM